MPDRPLPDLPPEMLLSYGGMRELEGAVAMRDQQAPMRPNDIFGDLEMAPPPVDEFNVSFDRDEGLDAEFAEARPFRTAATGARFNVLRPPQHEPFRPPPPVPGPQGGQMREVAQVRGYAVLAEDVVLPWDGSRPAVEDSATQRLQEQRRLLDAQSESRRESRRPTAAELNAKQAEKRAAIHETLPTAYDRLMGDDQYEDDLE